MFLESQFLTEEKEEDQGFVVPKQPKASAPVRPVSARTFQRAASQNEVHVYSNLLYGDQKVAQGGPKPSIVSAAGQSNDPNRAANRSVSLGAGADGPRPPTAVAFKGALSLATRGAMPQRPPSSLGAPLGTPGGAVVPPQQRTGGPISLSLPVFATQARPSTALNNQASSSAASSLSPSASTSASTLASTTASYSFPSAPSGATPASKWGQPGAPQGPPESAAAGPSGMQTAHRNSITIPAPPMQQLQQPAHNGPVLIPDRTRNDSNVSQANTDAAVAAMQGAGPNGAPVVCKVDVTNLRSFAHMPGPKSAVIQCYIVRDLSEGKRFPKYLLYLEDGDRFLLSAKRRKGSKTSNYVMSTDKNEPQREGPHYLGKVRSNVVGTEFNVYDDGYNPQKKPDHGEHMPRRELGVAQYERNVLGSKGPRNMAVLLPRPDLSEAQIPDPSSTKEGNWLAEVARAKDTRVLKFVSNPPRWNDQLNAFCLNFHGRVTQASVKNFQLVGEQLSQQVVMQFGKVAKDKFTMDYQYPLTALQAFGICLSSFDSKLACE